MSYCLLFLVTSMLYVIKKHSPEEAYLNRWVKHQQNNKIIARRSNLCASFETWRQMLRDNMSCKKNSSCCSICLKFLG